MGKNGSYLAYKEGKSVKVSPRHTQGAACRLSTREQFNEPRAASSSISSFFLSFLFFWRLTVWNNFHNKLRLMDLSRPARSDLVRSKLAITSGILGTNCSEGVERAPERELRSPLGERAPRFQTSARAACRLADLWCGALYQPQVGNPPRSVSRTSEPQAAWLCADSTSGQTFLSWKHRE